jgi:hypothetical protein
MRAIVKRTYTIDNGVECNKVMYAGSLMGITGTQIFFEDFDKAFLFTEDNLHGFNNQTISGEDRNGEYSFIQEIIPVKIIIEKE